MRYTPENTVQKGNPVRVFCDGVEMEGVVEADDKEGFVVFNKKEGGRLVISKGGIERETVRGSVRVEPLNAQ